MIKLLRDFLSSKKQNQLVGIVKYSNKIVIETYYKTDTGVYVRSLDVSVISEPSSDFELGEIILKHLNLSRHGIIYAKYDSLKSNEFYKKVTGLKSIKEQMNDSKYISVERQNRKIIITPHINGGTNGNKKGYTPKPNTEKVIESTNPLELGIIVGMAWCDCE